MDHIEFTILRNLVVDAKYAKKVTPFLRVDYFKDPVDRVLYEHISHYIDTYDQPPTIESIIISLQGDHKLPEKVYEGAVIASRQLVPVAGTNPDWLLNETEGFCKKSAIYNAIARSVQIIDGLDTELKPDSLPSLLSEALAVCFDTNVGHDYLKDAQARYDYYHREEERIPFDIDDFNRITDGGLPRKTLTCLLAGMNAGKSLVMCHMAAAALAAGQNVLYISMEMSEYVCAVRIDANLMNTPISEVKRMDEDKFLGKAAAIMKKTTGNLIIKEYPTSGAHVGHFKALLNELRVKKDFVPDIVFVDYLNICLSQRIKGSANANSYTIIKSISEELRGMAVEYDIPIVTATQTTRDGVGASDLDMTDVSESIGLAATVDMLLGIIRTPDLDQLNQLMFKLIKSRFVDAASHPAFMLGVDRSRMRLYELEASTKTNGWRSGNTTTTTTHEQPNNDSKDDVQPANFSSRSKFGRRGKFGANAS